MTGKHSETGSQPGIAAIRKRWKRTTHPTGAPGSIARQAEDDINALLGALDGVSLARDRELRELSDWLAATYETHIDTAADLDQGTPRWAAQCAKAEATLHVLNRVGRLGEEHE
jgi:hypothetical protein